MYVRVAIPSMVMICLDWWTFEVRDYDLGCSWVSGDCWMEIAKGLVGEATLGFLWAWGGHEELP